MMRKRNRVDLPEELVVEILSRVPAVSLARFRSISKGWNALIKDGRFAKKHLANAPRPSLVIMLNKFRVYRLNLNLNGMHDNVAPSVNIKDLGSNSLEEVDIREVYHCDGLLLCATKDNRLVVWNPWSGETRWIQPRNFYKESDYYGLGKSSCNKYKILRMDKSAYDIRYEVYDFTSNSWSVGYISDWFIPECWRRSVCVKGSTYWLACSRFHALYNHILLRFDFSTETFQSQLTFYSYISNDVSLSVVRDHGKLCLLTHPGSDTLELWMASMTESTGIMSWSKFLTVKTSNVFSDRLSFLADEQNKVVMCCDETQLPNNILHILTEDRHIKVDHRGAKSSYSPLLSYAPTLVQIPQLV